MLTQPLTQQCPLETQILVSTFCPFLYGGKDAEETLCRVLAANISPIIGSAFCSYPATSALQAILANSVGGVSPEKRAQALAKVVDAFGVNPSFIKVPSSSDANPTVNQVFLTPIDNEWRKGANNTKETRRARVMRRVINTEIDAVIEGESKICFVEAKMTSPLSRDNTLQLSQLWSQSLVAALVETLTEKTVSIVVVGATPEHVANNIGRHPPDELRPVDSELWKRAEEISSDIKTVGWREFSDEAASVPSETGRRWLEELAGSIKVFAKKGSPFRTVG